MLEATASALAMCFENQTLIIEARRLARNVEVDLPYVLHSFCITHKGLYLTLMHEKHRLGQEQSLSFQKSLNDREAKY